ncbi:hypothetical protein C7Y70_07045 [Pseudoalteromonas sp. KS88]|nr:hypothetical protein C7Y70_07045 [Pseudoalteromonas sp. KS88]
MRVSACETPKGLVALLILTIEPLFLAINALPKSLLTPTGTRILRRLGYTIIAKNSGYSYPVLLISQGIG